MDLTRRYVHAVVNNVAESQRSEVDRELSASIDDMARDKAGGKEPTEKHIRAVLEELGDPLLVARQYRSSGDYLIGPSLYFQYLYILKKIMLAGLPVYTLVFAITYDYVFPLNVVNTIVDWVGGLFIVILHILFWVTALFFVLEKTGIKVEQITDSREVWTVDQLPALPHEPHVKRSDAISGMFYYAFIVIGGVMVWKLIDQGGNAVASFFNPELTQYWIPAIIALGLAGLIVEITKLVVRSWNAWLLGVALAFNGLFIGYAIVLTSSQRIINESLSSPAHDVAIWSIGITALVVVLSYIYDSYKLIRSARVLKNTSK